MRIEGLIYKYVESIHTASERFRRFSTINILEQFVVKYVIVSLTMAMTIFYYSGLRGIEYSTNTMSV